MNVFKEKHALKVYLSKLKAQNKTVGFVPTMGALHEGHLSLIKKAKKKNDLVVVSIFVNPTQFDNPEDLIKYPKTLSNDIKLLESVSCDVLFHPSVKEIYDQNIVSDKFDFDGLEHEMEGKFRDGHFNGVGTIVKTLFEIVEPDKAYFGQKDFQQLQIIKKMVKKNRINIKIKGCKIFREEDGLAMSSRNTRLTTEHRNAAPFIYKTLKKARKKFGTENALNITEWVENQFKNHPLLTLEYFTIAEEKTLKTIKNKESDKKYRAFIAVFAGDIRLIDNIRLKIN
ncbi:pantoate--beta-alanine ligase [Polaribacter reichenbachii]|uniref:Pantothenate synthetase n=1 Tax=Polaribacter reichenbachii TaxID=996801 RepID=A0A1B8TV59_9FLAO|nr:pantoate--beta-alanine ligase [Polaribacter reichenbachii]APZ45629.1 pantoate--beta-alanine ligase [Polaribacter reichenbachii]AUC19491.1 pantoate--beta-alanine ligase [Polaribacter reichenbachii]OBY63355.1 pantoate--beta-alanine ligase [Polaribacter reichenbachii]